MQVSRVNRAALLVALVAFVVFLPSVADGWVFDDLILITGNDYVQHLRWLPRAFQTHLWDASQLAVTGELDGAVDTTIRYYRPLVAVSFLLTWVVAGGKAWAFHLGNVALHATTSGLLTRAAARWTRSALLAFLVGLVFALHPTRTENVTWISGRMDVLMFFFVLLALEVFTRYERAREAGSTRTGRLLALGLVLVACALLSKEPAVMAVLLILARDRRPDDPPLVPRIWQPLAATTALCALYGLARVVFYPTTNGGSHRFTPAQFFLTVEAYTQRVFFFWPPSMSFAPRTFDVAGSPVHPRMLVAGGVVIVIVGLVLLARAWTRSRAAFWLLLASAAFLGPLLNLFAFPMKDSAQDRFLYAPLACGLIGLARLFRAPALRVLRRPSRRRAVLAFTIVLALGAASIVVRRTFDYATDDSFWVAEARYHPDDPYVLQTLARSAARRGELERAHTLFARGARPEARLHQSVAARVAPHFEDVGLVGALLPDGRIDDLAALTDELSRTVAPQLVVRPRSVLGCPLGRPLPTESLLELQQQRVYGWDIALLATRTGDFAAAEAAYRAMPASRPPSNLLNGALVLARLGHIAEGRALLERGRASSAISISTRDIDAMIARLDHARRAEIDRDEAEDPRARHGFEAARLAGLGAYWSGLRELGRGHVLDVPLTRSLTLQLLVACRFDAAAETFAGKLGAEGSALLAEQRSALPPSLRALEPVAAPLDAIFAVLSAQ